VNATEWGRVKQLFNEALDRPHADREQFIRSAAGGDAQLHEAVARLLASHDDESMFLEIPAIESRREDLDHAPSEGRVGPYLILREIGRGGMGSVHLAARDDGEFRHKVAVKLVKRGMDTDMILRRFRYERQILADLHHPNIARLLDGGTSDDGRPYFVMEYIEGDSIDVYAAKHDLSVDDRLKLFLDVCRAVQFAHQNLVVHRDIKTSNIVVTPSGVTKLLDFGIAKLLDPSRDGGATDGTLTLRALTPEYASPEQVRGEPVTTASDVYSLGVLLYELLAGHRPYEVDARNPEAIAQVVCETDPVPPSSS
jgi:eukaryotic-like serine/threonine-protein kinase